jgi:hypothetical protein
MLFLASDVEARPAPLLVMASCGGHGKGPWGGRPSHDGHQPSSHYARMDAALDWASSSARWGFTPYWWLSGLSSCRGADSRLSTGVGLFLLQAQWQRRQWLPNYRSSSSLGSGSWTVEKASLLHGRVDWWLPSAPLGWCAWNVMLTASRPRLPNRITILGCAPLVPGLNTPSTLTGCWRSAGSSFAHRR